MSSGGTILLNRGKYNILNDSDVLYKRLNAYKLDRFDYYSQLLQSILTKINTYNESLNTINDDNDRQSLINSISDLKSRIEYIKTNIKELVTPTYDVIEQTHTLFVDYYYKPVAPCGFEYQKTVISVKPKLNTSFNIYLPEFGDFFSDMALYINLNGLEAVNPTNRVRYCNFLGHRLLSKVRFVSDNIGIDSINSEDYNTYYDYTLPSNKKGLWKKCIGQEQPIRGYLSPDPLNSSYRIEQNLYNGNQTLKQKHNNVKLIIPLIFWFSNINKAISNICYNDKTYITVTLADASEISTCVNYANDDGAYIKPYISDMVLYSNHIFVSNEIKDYINNMSGHSLIRVHESKKLILTSPFDSISLNEFIYPSEALYVSFRPMENLQGDEQMNNWNKNKKMEPNFIYAPIIFSSGGSPAIGYNTLSFYDEVEIIDTLSLKTVDLNIYAENNNVFYNSYIQYKYGNGTNNPDEIQDSYMFSFSPNPRQKELCGYLDLGQLIDLKLNYTSSIISTDYPVQVHISSHALNLIHYKKGKVELLF